MFSSVVAGAVLFTVCNLVTGAPVGEGTSVTTYASGFELRTLPADWILCAPMKNLDNAFQSYSALAAFSQGFNDQEQPVVLSRASLIIVDMVGEEGEYCRYIEEESIGTLFTSSTVTMKQATSYDYYGMKVERATLGLVKSSFEDLKAAIAQEGGEPSEKASFDKIIVEVAANYEAYVGAAKRST